ncbi:MAG: branched-chain amino acid ABC transporter permease [Deltaproteobacteria bacterium]|nr:branched-chain amino acid ABC transporter permease [Deltaproteobacteria bacterium]
MIKKSSRWLITAAVVLLSVMPLVLSQSLINAAIQMLIALLFACAFNLLCGQGGMLSFGHSAYFGVGAFTTIHIMSDIGGKGLLPTPLLPLAGMCGGFLFGLAAGWFSTKRTGVYFSMITLAIAELLHAISSQLKGLFGGEAGISVMRAPAWGLSFGNATQMYYLTLGWVLLSLVMLYFYTGTPVGRLTLAVRENSHRLRFLGYKVHTLKVLAFAVSAMFVGVAGSLQAINNEACNYVIFDLRLSAEVVLNTYIGGVNVFLGPALGAAVMTFFGYAVSDLTRSWLLYQGVLFVLVMLFMPTGLAGLMQWWMEARRNHSFVALLPILALSLLSALLLIVGSVFMVEMTQRIFSQDYQSLLRVAQSSAWPPVSLFGRQWPPGSLLTWSAPLLCLICGLFMVKMTRKQWFILKENNSDPEGAAIQDSEVGKASSQPNRLLVDEE